jgi:molybdopterin-guanine dinucleotide biosynthesis protein
MTVREKLRTIVAVSGFSSNAGKTTLMCALLRAFPGWEAIKMTRGHFRSCGKDPEACCVSHLLSDEPVIRSGQAHTYAPGKDTGRYWDAGASGVQWVIVMDGQVEQGIRRALEGVEAEGVFVEGNSFLKYVEADFIVLAARAGGGQIKPSARRLLARASALYLFDEDDADRTSGGASSARERFAAWAEESGVGKLSGHLPVYTREDLPQLVARVREVHDARQSSLAGMVG